MPKLFVKNFFAIYRDKGRGDVLYCGKITPNAPITTWQKGDEVEGFYLLSDAAVKTSNAGKPF